MEGGCYPGWAGCLISGRSVLSGSASGVADFARIWPFAVEILEYAPLPLEVEGWFWCGRNWLSSIYRDGPGKEDVYSPPSPELPRPARPGCHGQR